MCRSEHDLLNKILEGTLVLMLGYYYLFPSLLMVTIVFPSSSLILITEGVLISMVGSPLVVAYFSYPY